MKRIENDLKFEKIKDHYDQLISCEWLVFNFTGNGLITEEFEPVIRKYVEDLKDELLKLNYPEKFIEIKYNERFKGRRNHQLTIYNKKLFIELWNKENKTKN